MFSEVKRFCLEEQTIEFQSGRSDLPPEVASLLGSQVKKNTNHVNLQMYFFLL